MHQQIGITEATTAVALGGCLAVTAVSVAQAATSIDPAIADFLPFAAVGLAGELVAMLSLVSLYAISCFHRSSFVIFLRILDWTGGDSTIFY